MKTVIWLEDNPASIKKKIKSIQATYANKLDIEVWDGKYSSDRGLECTKHFKNKITQSIQNKSKIVAFILDVRIPIDDLSELGLPNIKVDKGLISGVQIAQYYLRNNNGYSSLGDEFKNTPILFLTVAGGTADEFPWVGDETQNYFFIEKTTQASFNKVETWLRKFV